MTTDATKHVNLGDGRSVHFISGLPRSGSTLLSALLRQNPQFTATMTTPVAMLWGTLLPKMGGKGEFSSFFDDEKRGNILRSTLEGFYHDKDSRQVIFDTNRTWSTKLPLIGHLYPRAKVICCVRSIGWIIDSVERLLRKNPLQTSRIFDFKADGTVYSRVEMLMNSERGLVGLPWSALREAWFSEQASRLIVLDYDRLVENPGEVMEKLYAEIDQPYFEHDFDNVEYDEPTYDTEIGMPGLHHVRQRVGREDRASCLPPDLFRKYADTAFWAEPTMNKRGVIVL